MDKLLIGNAKPGKYPDQYDIGLNKSDLEKLSQNVNEKGWVNIRLAKSKAGKMYIEIL